MEPWQRFGRQRLAQSRWNCEPAAIDAVDRQAFEAAWQRQAQLEQLIVAQLRRRRSPPRCWRASPLRYGPGWMREDLRQRSGAAIVLHHARLESAFAGIASRAPRPDPCRGAGLVSAASGAVYAPGTAPDPPSAAHRRWRRPGGFTRVYGSFMGKSKPPRGVCAAGPATLPLPERAGRRTAGLDRPGAALSAAGGGAVCAGGKCAGGAGGQ